MANREDRDLGMDRPISLRDVLNGIEALAVGTMIPGRALADKVLALERAGEAAAGYSPALTGLRGSHVGSFEVAHQLALSGQTEWGPVEEPGSRVSTDDLREGSGLRKGRESAHRERSWPCHPMALPGTSWHYRTEPSIPNSEATPVGYRIPGTASEAGGRAFESRPGHHFVSRT